MDMLKVVEPIAHISHRNRLNHEYVSVPVEIVVWIYGAFDNNFEIGNNLTKYLEESCR